MAAYFEFEPEKALVATAYLADRSGETMYTILKMVYVADRLHLERYGRPITGDRFIAMAQGACPSKIYDSMKVLRGDENNNYLPESEHYLSVDAITYDVVVKDMPSLDVLSASEIECLDETVSILKRRGPRHIRDLAHDAAWKETGRNATMDFLAIAKSIEDGGDILAQHLETRFSS
ncbi:MAG: Panacea domain-containing protein [Sulfuritalea sp.]|jgi:hypothetical protein|nr:Panacea domain-containing protein [Sulfuritalea sp.]